jgi:hypothetical protein
MLQVAFVNRITENRDRPTDQKKVLIFLTRPTPVSWTMMETLTKPGENTPKPPQEIRQHWRRKEKKKKKTTYTPAGGKMPGRQE